MKFKDRRKLYLGNGSITCLHPAVLGLTKIGELDELCRLIATWKFQISEYMISQ